VRMASSRAMPLLIVSSALRWLMVRSLCARSQRFASSVSRSILEWRPLVRSLAGLVHQVAVAQLVCCSKRSALSASRAFSASSRSMSFAASAARLSAQFLAMSFMANPPFLGFVFQFFQ
jgi:hypothetical protein